MSWWAHCTGRSIGRCLHFLWHYCGLDVAEQAQFGDGNRISYRGKPLAEIARWDGNVPHFEFTDPAHAEEQDRLREVSVTDGRKARVEGERKDAGRIAEQLKKYRTKTGNTDSDHWNQYSNVPRTLERALTMIADDEVEDPAEFARIVLGK